MSLTSSMTKTLAVALLLGAARAPAQHLDPSRLPQAGGFQAEASNRISVENFWTSDRLASAKPMPLPQLDPPTAALEATEAATNLPPRMYPSTPPRCRERLSPRPFYRAR
jgi:hypothetical protein